MTLATRTINPLHFEDLDPSRFEDLVRQLMYDFKNWRQLEATGRSGSDNGFDIRGWEVETFQENIEESEEPRENFFNDKIWMIQCKREKMINPQKMEGYLEDILPKNKESIYGIIFVAACNFSEKTRIVFHEICAANNIQGFHLLGKAGLEDLLFLPKNDRLLFAYFGISLAIRRRSLRTRISEKITMKRKTIKALENQLSVLLRDPNADKYPYRDELSASEPRWNICRYISLEPKGIKFLIGEYFAYFNPANEKWDYIKEYKNRKIIVKDPWNKDFDKKNSANKEICESLHEELEDNNNAAMYSEYGIIPYENIIAIDEIGDNITANIPHIYVEFINKGGPFKYIYSKIQLNMPEVREVIPDVNKRIKYFKLLSSYDVNKLKPPRSRFIPEN